MEKVVFGNSVSLVAKTGTRFGDYIVKKFNQPKRNRVDESKRRIEIVEKNIDLSHSIWTSNSVCQSEGSFYYSDPVGGIIGIPKETGVNVKVEINRRMDPDSAMGHLIYGVTQEMLLLEEKTLLHASSFVYGGKTFLLPAWAGTGKTNILLEALKRGAKLLSDDLAIIDRKGKIEPIRKPIGVYHYNVKWNEKLKKEYTRSRRTSILFERVTDRVYQLLERYSPEAEVTRGVKKVNTLTKNMLRVELNPEQVNEKSGWEDESFVDTVAILVRKRGKMKRTTIEMEEAVEACDICIKNELSHYYEKIEKAQYLARLSGAIFKRREGSDASIYRDAFKEKQVVVVEVPESIPPQELFNFVCEQ